MAHAEGTVGIKAAVRAGVDSIEHGTMLDDEGAKMMADLGATVFVSSPTDFATYLAAETEKWGKVVRTANLKAD